MRSVLLSILIVSVIGLFGLGVALIDFRSIAERLGLIVPVVPDARLPTFGQVQRGEVSTTPEPPGAQQIQILRALAMRNCVQRQRSFAQADGVAVDEALMRAHCIRAADATVQGRDMEARELRESPYYRGRAN